MKKHIIQTRGELEDFLTVFDSSFFSFDTETTDLRQDKLEIVGWSFCDGIHACYIKHDDLLIDLIKTIFKDGTGKTIICHNAVFDLRVISKVGINPKNAQLFDTMIAAHLINENESKSLKFLAKSILNQEDVISWKDAVSAGFQVFANYALNDAIWTYQLYQHFAPLIESEGMTKLFYKIEMPFQWVLLEMVLTGVTIDTTKRENIEKQLTNDVYDSIINLHKLVDKKCYIQVDLSNNMTVIPTINFNSSQQVGKIFFDTLGLNVIETTPGGKPSVGAKTIEAYKDIPFVKAFDEYQTQKKILTSFIVPLVDFIQTDGKVRPDFRDTGTATGRLSCQKPNLQQLPKADKDPYGVRSLFCAPKGYKMITCDYSGQEVLVMAQQSKDKTLIDLLVKGQDTHLKVANQFFGLGIPDECLYETHPEFESYKKKFKKERTQAKVITFGLAYGKGAFGFAKDFNVSEEEAQKLIDKYFEGMPDVKQAIEAAHKDVKEKGYVTTLAGRKRRFTPLTDPESGYSWYPKAALRKSFNFLIQGFSSDMIRKAMVMVQRDSKPEWDLKAIMTVHDEGNWQCKEEYAEVCGAYIKKQFESAVNLCVPVNATVDITDNYGQAK